MLAVTFGPQLVALIAGPADPPPNRSGRPRRPGGRSIRMLPMLWLRAGPSKVGVMNADMLLELLESVVRARGERVKSCCVKVAARNMAVRQQRR